MGRGNNNVGREINSEVSDRGGHGCRDRHDVTMYQLGGGNLRDDNKRRRL